MNLKEAFRYQNFIESQITALTHHLMFKQNVVTVSQLHKRHDVNPDVENETVDATVESTYSATTDELAQILVILLNEKVLCGEAITCAKAEYDKECGFDLDAQVAANKHRQSIAKTLTTLGGYKETKRISAGTGYKFNAEGVQAPYRYDIEETVKPAFDTSSLKLLGKELMRKADKVSSIADKCMIDTIVQFEPMFSPTDSMEDIIEIARHEMFHQAEDVAS